METMTLLLEIFGLTSLISAFIKYSIEKRKFNSQKHKFTHNLNNRT